MKKAFIIENNLKLKEVYVTKEVGNRYLIVFGDSSGFWIHKDRVYFNMSTAYQELRKRRPDIDLNKILPDTYVTVENNAVCHGL